MYFISICFQVYSDKILVKSGDEIAIVYVKDRISDNEYVVTPDEALRQLQKKKF